MIQGLDRLLRRVSRDVSVATVAVKAVAAITEPTEKQKAFDEMWRRWNNVPLSDLRGQHHTMLNFLAEGFEKKLPPWKRWTLKSNGRKVAGRRQLVRPIRGVHIRTRGDR